MYSDDAVLLAAASMVAGLTPAGAMTPAASVALLAGVIAEMKAKGIEATKLRPGQTRG
jgi:hypothetical protein